MRLLFQKLSLCLPALVLLALSGCNDPPRRWPMLAAEVTFQVDVVPAGKDGKIEVRVTSSDPNVWASTLGETALVPPARVLNVYRSQVTPEGQTIVAADEVSQPGHYRVEGPNLYFEPEFAPNPGEPWIVEFKPYLLHPQLYSPNNDEPMYTRFGGVTDTLPDRPVVLQILPQDVVPANAIGLTIFFSEPMKKGEERLNVSLIDKVTGLEVEDAFSPNVNWTGNMLNLQFNPERQANAVRDLEKGLKRKGPQPVLQEGRTYEIKVFGDWESERGVPLGNYGVSKIVEVGPPDNAPPDPQRWNISVPLARTRQGMAVSFEEPYSYPSLFQSLSVRAADGTPIPQRESGLTGPTDDARAWQFEPLNPWEPGEYELAVSTLLSDQAGNTIAGPFQVDKDGFPVTPKFEVKTVKFKIGK